MLSEALEQVPESIDVLRVPRRGCPGGSAARLEHDAPPISNGLDAEGRVNRPPSRVDDSPRPRRATRWDGDQALADLPQRQRPPRVDEAGRLLRGPREVPAPVHDRLVQDGLFSEAQSLATTTQARSVAETVRSAKPPSPPSIRTPPRVDGPSTRARCPSARSSHCSSAGRANTASRMTCARPSAPSGSARELSLPSPHVRHVGKSTSGIAQLPSSSSQRPTPRYRNTPSSEAKHERRFRDPSRSNRMRARLGAVSSPFRDEEEQMPTVPAAPPVNSSRPSAGELLFARIVPMQGPVLGG